MKKVLVLCSEEKLALGSFRFIKQMAEHETIFVVGLFFTANDVQPMVHISYMPHATAFSKMKEKEIQSVDNAKQLFSYECEAVGIRYKIHPYKSGWDIDLFVKESRFADVVIISEEFFCMDESGFQPNFFMEQALRLSECPLVLVPESHRIVDRLTVAYDGSRESMFALKQFLYLFPYYAEHPADFITVTDDESLPVPEVNLFREYTGAHFQSMYASSLRFDPAKYLSAWVENRKDVFLITGAYSRSARSIAFRQSFIKEMITRHLCPIFIAHTGHTAP